MLVPSPQAITTEHTSIDGVDRSSLPTSCAISSNQTWYTCTSTCTSRQSGITLVYWTDVVDASWNPKHHCPVNHIKSCNVYTSKRSTRCLAKLYCGETWVTSLHCPHLLPYLVSMLPKWHQEWGRRTSNNTTERRHYWIAKVPTTGTSTWHHVLPPRQKVMNPTYVFVPGMILQLTVANLKSVESLERWYIQCRLYS